MSSDSVCRCFMYRAGNSLEKLDSNIRPPKYSNIRILNITLHTVLFTILIGVILPVHSVFSDAA